MAKSKQAVVKIIQGTFSDVEKAAEKENLYTNDQATFKLALLEKKLKEIAVMVNEIQIK